VYHIKGWGKFNRNYGDFCTGADTIHEPSRVAQEDVGRQCGDGPHSRMRHEQSCSATLLGLLCHLLRQVFNFLFHLLIQGLQCAPSIRGMGRQRQEGDLGLPVVAPQTRTSA